MNLQGHLWLLAAALVVDAAVGDPDLVWRRVPHPVALMGRLVGLFDKALNQERFRPAARRLWGVFALVEIVVLAGAVGYTLQLVFAEFAYGWIGTVIVASVLFAGRSLHDHVAAVAKAFRRGGLDAARSAVAKIVGRDPASLDEAGVCRAAIESTAENFSDGVVAPALWFVLLGLPGLCAYKAINTADSMIGHRTTRYRDFGWAAARLDDFVNLPASRLAGLLVAVAAPLAGGSFRTAFRAMLDDAPKHRSPNAGWPEAAMAGALGIALAGPRRYGGVLVDDPFLNDPGRKDASPADIGEALRVYLGAWLALLFSVLLVAFLA